MTDRDDRGAIAVIGMAGRFPLAPNVDSFWAACRDGVDCISRWQGVRAETRVPAGGLMLDPDLFDAEAFGIPPAEAELLDPQHRVFLELCLEALEHGSVVGNIDTLVSVYAAAAPSRYRPAGEATGEIDRYQRIIANAPDYVATRVSYQLDLRGEAVNVQTACSSSLVAVHLACQSLLSNRSDIALAGGVSIDPDQYLGYRHEPGMITSPDGVCLPFDAEARGAVPGNGGAVVVLQRLADAVAERRVVHAVIRATVVNNDGRNKASFMAPNVEGQSELIVAALAQSGAPADSIEYLETHGTATRLGDAIEFEAARMAFRQFTQRRTFCALGSLKANFGHLDRAAGVAGLIKVIHAVRDGVIPPLFGFRAPNPDFDLAASPFRVPTAAEPWRTSGPRRAGVSAFGIGGTNAHAVVEQYSPTPSAAVEVPARGPVALALSANSEERLQTFVAALAERVNAGNARDVAHTLANGRAARATRAVVVDEQEALADRLRRPLATGVVAANPGPLAVLFAGQGAALAYDAPRLAARYDLFRQEIQRFATALGVSADKLLDGVSGADPEYRDFAYQPALVAVQIGLARLAEGVGLDASAYCGHSLGEYSAAFLAGIFDAASLMTVLAARDRVMRAAPEGRMLSVLAGEEVITPHLIDGVDLAGDIWRDRVLLSGEPERISRQEAIFEARGILSRVLPGRVGPHGRLMRPVADAFRPVFREVRLRPASRPLISTLTGDWAEPDRLADPEHWLRHLCEPFRFRQAFETFAASGFTRFAEASPGTAMTTLVRTAAVSCASLGAEGGDPAAAFLNALGELWCAGAPIDWDRANGSANGRFTTLPPYPFQRRRYWTHRPATSVDRPGARGDGLLEHPVWRIRPFGLGSSDAILPHTVVVHGRGPIADTLIQQLTAHGRRALPWDPESRALVPGSTVVDLTLASERATPDLTAVSGLREWLDGCVLHPIAPLAHSPATLVTVTRGLWEVAPGELPDLSAAGVIGVARCAPHDWPGLRTRLVDLDRRQSLARDVEAILAELSSRVTCDVAYRGAARYERHHEDIVPLGASPLRQGGTYVVLGGTGRLGAVVAEAISREVTARIVLVGRDDSRPLPTASQRLIAVAEARCCQIIRRAAHTDERESLRRVLDEFDGDGGHIDGVFHLAANTTTSSFELLGEATADAAVALARAKVCTAALLAEELVGRHYDFVVLFSSISTVIGASRFGVYVAANAYLDALAAVMRTQTGRHWQSLIWDGWAADGIATGQALGFDNGTTLLLQALRCDAANVAPAVQPLDARRAAVWETLATVAAAHQPPEAPEPTSIADRVRRVICDVTGYTELEPKQTFASLGIGSLRLMQIAVRLRPLLGGRSRFGTLLTATSMQGLIELVSAERDAPLDERHGALPPGALSTPQQRLWYLTQLDPRSPGYNVPFGWTVPAPANRHVRDAVIELLARHDMLRAAYTHDEKGHPVRVTTAAGDMPIGEIRLPDSESDFDRIVRVAVDAPFDLRRESTRVLIAAGGRETRVVFVCHHLSIDAWSIRLLGSELARLLTGAALPPLRASYHDFVCAEHELRSGSEFERLARYWRDTLATAVPTLPPADEGLSASDTRPVATNTAVLPPDQLETLRAVLRDQGATVFTAALTGLAVALAQWCGGREVVIGTNVANRTSDRLESVVGMFVDPVVLRLVPGLDDDTATLGAALAGVRQSLTSAIAHAGMPYLDVVQAADQRRAPGTNPLFSVIATMFDADDEHASLAPLDVPLPAMSKFPLAVEFLPRADGLLIHVLYAADRYRPATIERLSRRILRYLTALAHDPRTLLSEVLDSAPGPARVRFTRRFTPTERANG